MFWCGPKTRSLQCCGALLFISSLLRDWLWPPHRIRSLSQLKTNIFGLQQWYRSSVLWSAMIPRFLIISFADCPGFANSNRIRHLSNRTAHLQQNHKEVYSTLTIEDWEH